MDNNTVKNQDKNIVTFVVLNGFVCPVYKEIDSDDRKEWDD